MRKIFLLCVGVALFTSMSTTAVHAATACFDWSCNESSGLCTIDASCSSASPYIWKYQFDFGDGTATGLTGNKVQYHQYGSSVYEATVTLRILYFGDPGENAVACTINTRLFPVGPQPPPSVFQGRCSQ
jgi:hypothetical protein